MAAVKRNKDGSIYEPDVKAIADAISPVNSGCKEPYWDMSAASMIEFVIAYALEALPKSITA